MNNLAFLCDRAKNDKQRAQLAVIKQCDFDWAVHEYTVFTGRKVTNLVLWSMIESESQMLPAGQVRPTNLTFMRELFNGSNTDVSIELQELDELVKLLI